MLSLHRPPRLLEDRLDCARHNSTATDPEDRKVSIPKILMAGIITKEHEAGRMDEELPANFFAHLVPAYCACASACCTRLAPPCSFLPLNATSLYPNPLPPRASPLGTPASRFTARHAGSLLLSQSGERSERYIESFRFDTMPSTPLQAWAKTVGPSPSMCSLNRMPGRALATVDASVALRTSSG